MELKAKILAMLKEGKSQDEITLECIESGETAENVGKALDAALEAQKALNVVAGSKKIKEESAEMDAKVIAGVEAVLEKADTNGVLDKFKSLGINAKPEQKTYKKFDLGSGQEVVVGAQDVNEAKMNEMFYAYIDGDVKKAKAISNEIAQENARINKILGKAANDPVRSDSAADGGYTVPTLVSDRINQLAYMNSVVLQNAQTDNIVVNDKIYPLVYGSEFSDIADQTTALTEAQQTFTNPTVEMERAGYFLNIANTIIRQRGDIVPALITAAGSAWARFLDLRLIVGNVTNTGDLVDGLVFDGNTNLPTAIARAALDIDALAAIKNALSAEATGNVVWMGNRQVVDTIGLLENSAGNREFAGYVNGGSISPLGIPMIQNVKIPSVLDVGGDARAGGSDDVLICADLSQFIVGIGNEMRVEFSDQFRFTNDAVTMRAIGQYGCKVLSSATGEGTGGGIVAVAQELTNA